MKIETHFAKKETCASHFRVNLKKITDKRQFC